MLFDTDYTLLQKVSYTRFVSTDGPDLYRRHRVGRQMHTK